MKPVGSVGLTWRAEAAEHAEPAANLFARYATERCDLRVAPGGHGEFTVDLANDRALGAESYRIASVGNAVARISGGDRLGLIYGVGKFLHTSHYTPDGFVASPWRGASAPDCPMRGMYLATHFDNFYETAPADEVQRYVEDLALWGINSLLLHFGPSQYASMDAPEAQANLKQIRGLMRIGRRLGLRVGLIQTVNKGWADAPRELRAKPYPDDWHRRGTLGVNICPSNPEGRRYLMDIHERLFDFLADTGVDILCPWPYDEGGCGCDPCWPWGSKGFLDLSRDVAKLARQSNPHLQVILSTWMFDSPPAGEWAGLRDALAAGNDWIDYIMADAHEDFPRYPLVEGVPGGLPLVNFPEISMWGMWPWGGCGANPLPQRLQRLWNQVRSVAAGGFPYSEGIFEDLNKVVCLGFQWQKDRPVEEILREYVGCEYSAAETESLLAVLATLERNHVRDIREPTPPVLTGAAEAFDRIERAERTLTSRVRAGWRWRILYLRALIDRELELNGGRFKGAAIQEAFAELSRIYHVTANTLDGIHPPRPGDL